MRKLAITRENRDSNPIIPDSAAPALGTAQKRKLDLFWVELPVWRRVKLALVHSSRTRSHQSLRDITNTAQESLPGDAK